MMTVYYVMEKKEETGEKAVLGGKRRIICRYGRLPFQRSLLWQWEMTAETGENRTFGDRLQLVCFGLPQGLRERKKQKLLTAIRAQCGPLWLSAGLAETLSEYQPVSEEELLLFRLLFLRKETERKWKKTVQSLAVWEDAARPGAALSLLPYLTEEINYLTVIGGREEDYGELAELLWKENGLPIRFLKKPISGYPYGPALMVLNMAPGRKLPSGIWKQDFFCADVLGGMAKFLDTIAGNGYNS